MSTFEYAGYTIDFTKLPQASIDALLRRGAVHFLGNEQASKVTAWAGKQETAPDDEAKAAKRLEYIASAIDALNAGTVGVRAPREGGASAKLDPIGAMVRKLAKTQVLALLKKAGLKAPTGENTVATGSGEFTMAQLIDRAVARGGEALVAEAKKAVEAEARRNAKVVEAAGEVEL
jgi:hypothetical protein